MVGHGGRDERERWSAMEGGKRESGGRPWREGGDGGRPAMEGEETVVGRERT